MRKDVQRVMATKKKVIGWLCVVLLVLAAVLTYSFIRVDGKELRCLSDISVAYTGTVIKTHATLDYSETEYILNGEQLSNEQILQLKELIQNSSFTRMRNSGFTYTGLKDRYDIYLELTDQQGNEQDIIKLHIVEDLYIIVLAPYDDINLFLRINNPQWHAELDAILEGS